MTNEQIIEKIIALNKELDMLKDELLKNENIEPSKPLTGWERVDYGDTYYYIDADHCVAEDTEATHDFDSRSYDVANYFSTEKKAQEIADKQTLLRKLQRFADEKSGGAISDDWYEIIYENGRLDTMCCDDVFAVGGVKFASREHAQKAIELFEKELLEYFTK